MSEFLNNSDDSGLPAGHPVRVYIEENQLIRDTISNIHNINIKDNPNKQATSDSAEYISNTVSMFIDS